MPDYRLVCLFFIHNAQANGRGAFPRPVELIVGQPRGKQKLPIYKQLQN